MKKILYILVLFFMFIPSVLAEEKNIVNIYLFHSNSCQHCKKENKLLDKLEEEYDNIRVYKYEISEDDNSHLLAEVSHLLDARVGGVPFTVFGG